MQLQRAEKLCMLPKRPRGTYSNQFKPLNVATNHFKVEVDLFQQIHIFSVVYNPTIPYDNSALRRKLLEQGKAKIKASIDNPVISGNNIYCIRPPKSQNFEVESGKYRITIKKVKQLNLKENPKMLLSFLNNGLRNVMRTLNYMQIGRSGKFFNSQQKTLIDNLMMFDGYRSTFVLLQNGFFLKVDSAKKIVRNQTVLEFIDGLYKMHQSKDREERRHILQVELANQIVMTNYGKTAYHKIQQLLFQDMDTIVLQDGIGNLREYYERKYNLTVSNKKQPLLKIQSRRKSNNEFPIILVPEFCLMTGIPENFDELRRKKISENTIKPADQKQREILNLMGELRANQDFSALKEMGITISQKLETVKAKVIPMPQLNLGENNAVEQGKQAFFNLFNKPIFANKFNIRCAILHFTAQDPKILLQTFESTSRNLKVKFQSVKMNMGNFDFKNGVSMLEDHIRTAAEENNCNICLILLPNQFKTQYKKIKISALVKHKIVCQMATEATLRKKNLQSIATKILLQIIAKRGNTLWVPKIPSNLGKAMILAFQYAKVGSKTSLAMCSTTSPTLSTVFAQTNSYEGSESKFNAMIKLTLQGIDAYVHQNKELPSEVIIFNNSTSNDQIALIQNYYVNSLKTKLGQIYKGKAMAITMVMVNVKTCERFFTEGENNVRNVPAGTLISTNIVSNFYDFYVVSQASNKGCTVPNHYKVIYSDSKLEEGVLQELVFSQCFNYVNWTGSIKVPGILQYASKCAKFSSEVLQNEQVCNELQGKLYFV